MWCYQKKGFSYLKASVDGLVIWEFIWFDIDLNPVEVEIWENNVEGLFGVAGKRRCCCWFVCWLCCIPPGTTPPPWLTWFPITVLEMLEKKLLVPLTIDSSIDFVFVDPRIDGTPLVNRFNRFGWLYEFEWEFALPGTLKKIRSLELVEAVKNCSMLSVEFFLINVWDKFQALKALT